METPPPSRNAAGTAIYKQTVAFRVDDDLAAKLRAFTDTFPSGSLAIRSLLTHPDVVAVMNARISTVTEGVSA